MAAVLNNPMRAPLYGFPGRRWAINIGSEWTRTAMNYHRGALGRHRDKPAARLEAQTRNYGTTRVMVSGGAASRRVAARPRVPVPARSNRNAAPKGFLARP